MEFELCTRLAHGRNKEVGEWTAAEVPRQRKFVSHGDFLWRVQGRPEVRSSRLLLACMHRIARKNDEWAMLCRPCTSQITAVHR